MTSGSSGQWYNKDHQSQPSYRNNNDRYQSSGSRPNESRYPSTRGGSSVDYNNRRYSRDAPPTYSSGRDHHRSPDPLPRKRMRTDSYSPASSRRSHDGGYEYSSSTRYEYGSDKGSYSSEDRGRPMYREERRPSADRRDDFHSPRSRDPSGSTMPPPSGPVRGGSYRSRGAPIRGRGVTRVFTRRPTDVSLAARKTRLIEAYAAKRRILTGRSQDYYKKLKSLKLRSAALMSARRDGIKSEHGDSEDEAENWDDEPDMKDSISENEEGAKDPDDEDTEEKKKVVRKVVKKVPIKKKAAPSAEHEGDDSKDATEDAEGKEKATDDQVADDDAEAAEEVEGDQEGDGEPKMQVTIKQDSESRDVCDEGIRKPPAAKSGYKYIKLYCVHCKERYITFKEYQNHLRGLHHVNAMRKLSFRLKQNLARMRVEQRIQQRVDEKEDELRGVTGGRTSYCQTCKLNYRSDRAKHNESEMHKKMKEFLMPTCVICRINFRSPMLFENHICSLEHIKMEERVLKGRDREHHAEKEVDMDSLLVLDSVGSADESDSEEEGSEDKSERGDGEKKKKKAQINLGADYVKKVQVMYCELCGIYLPRTGEEDVALANHCRTRNHLQRYVRYKDDRALRKEAERIHRRDKAEQEARKAQEAKKEVGESSSSAEKAPSKDENAEEKPEKSANTSLDASGDNVDLDDKLWADVDKRLDELLEEVEPGNKSSDDDDESGRYDRFRYSDKKGGKASSEDREGGETSNSSLPSAADTSSKQEVTSPKEN